MPSSPEINRIKVAGTKYAQDFLVQKYYDEYEELYEAYLENRGIFTKPKVGNLVDEREIRKQRLSENK